MSRDSDSIDELLNEEYDPVVNDNEFDPDNPEWHIPPNPPKDVFFAEFKKAINVQQSMLPLAEQQIDDEDQVHKIEYRAFRGNLPAQLYNLMSWNPVNPSSYPPYIVKTSDDIVLATMDAFCDAFRKIDPSHLDHIEVEGRLGLLLNKNTRIFPKCASEAIMFNDSNSTGFMYKRFASEVHFKDFEIMMHYLKQQQQHNKVFYMGEGMISDDIYKGYRVRKYEKIINGSKTIVEEVTKKHALMTLDIFNPRYKYDYRIQINVEEPVTVRQQYDLPQMQRRTKRIRCQHFNIGYDFSEIDQTVIQPQGNEHRKLVSTEIEALNPKDTLYKHFKLKEAGSASRMMELTEGFVGHLRELTQLFPNEMYAAASNGSL